MRFSVWSNYERPWDEALALARQAEAWGWHGVWYADHYMPNTEDGAPADGPVLECWSVIGALAAAVPRLRLGTLVSPTTVHHPALLAKRACTIDQISGGRFVLGLGAGWQVNEHTAYGIDLLAPGVRVDRFAEALQIVRSLLVEQRTTFTGTHFTVTDAPCDPKPVQSPLPIMVGTGSPRMLRLTARHADEWNTWGTPEEVTRRRGLLLAACEKEGRDPATLRVSAQAMIVIVDDDAKAEAVRSRLPADRALVGSTGYLVEQIARYAELGVDEFIIPDFTLGPTAEARLAAYARLDDEVVSALA
jgi:probable F420-dependent oxidoreductase